MKECAVRKLFVSIRGAIGALMCGHVTAADLADGLFFLCGTGPATFNEPDYPEHPVKRQLADAMQQAEEEGRGRWAKPSDVGKVGGEYTLLNQLLEKHGFKPIDESPADEQIAYRQAAVAARLRGQELEVITYKWWNPPRPSDETRIWGPDDTHA